MRELVLVLVFVSAAPFVADQAAADDHYYESLAYTVEASSASTAYACSLQFVSLVSNLSSLRISVPYPREDLNADPVVFVGKTGIKPDITLGDETTVLDLEFEGMRVGEMETIDMRYVVKKGTEIKPGATIEIRTLGLTGNVTYQGLSLKLPGGYLVSKIETPDGTVKGSSGGAPLNLGREPVTLNFVLRRRNLLDYQIFVWGVSIAVIGLAIGIPLYLKFGRARARAANA